MKTPPLVSGYSTRVNNVKIKIGSKRGQKSQVGYREVPHSMKLYETTRNWPIRRIKSRTICSYYLYYFFITTINKPNFTFVFELAKFRSSTGSIGGSLLYESFKIMSCFLTGLEIRRKKENVSTYVKEN